MLEFSRSEQLTLRAWYGTTKPTRLAATLRRSPEEIHAEAVRLGLRSPTKASLAAIEASEAREVAYRKRNLAEMATAARLRAAQQAKQLNRPIPKPRAETRAEKEAAIKARNDAILAEFPHVLNIELARKYNLSVVRIQQLASINGVHKSDRHLKSARKNKPHHNAMRSAIARIKAGEYETAIELLQGALA